MGTQMLSLHASLAALVPGSAGEALAGLATVVWTLRSLRAATPRGLVTGQRKRGRRVWRLIAGAAAAAAAAAFGSAAFASKLNQTAGYFGAGTLLPIAALLFLSAWLQESRQHQRQRI